MGFRFQYFIGGNSVMIDVGHTVQSELSTVRTNSLPFQLSMYRVRVAPSCRPLYRNAVVEPK